MANKPEIIVVGSVAIDKIRNFDGDFADYFSPEKLHAISVSFTALSGKEFPGGVAANICRTLALLGECPYLLAAVGADALGYINELAQLGIRTEYIYFSSKPTAEFTVITDQSNNQIGVFYQGAMSDHEALALDPWQNQNALVVISPYSPEVMNRFVEEAHEYAIRYVFDPGQQIINFLPEDLLRAVSGAEIVIMNEYESSLLVERVGMSLDEIRRIVPIFITTYGKDGSLISGSAVKEPLKIEAVSNVKVVDPTGAGDAYRAGFLYGYTTGWSLDICGKMGSLAAAYAIEQKGAQEHFFNQTTFAQRYQETFGESLSEL